MDEQPANAVLPPEDSLPMQAHTCTAIIEELVAETPEDSWDDAE